MSKSDPYAHLGVSLNTDGSLTRHRNLSTSAATGECPQNPTIHAVLSKDVTLNKDKKTWMRIYCPGKLPSNDNSVARLPVIFFHGGVWIHNSVATADVHDSNNRMSAELPAIVVSVEFRLAPESRLPAQYEDAVDAVSWVRNQAADKINGDQWIREYSDFYRCYLYGVNCGGNVAFNAALRMQPTELQPLKIAGVILNQPFFGGTKSELDEYFPVPVRDLLWELALPVGADQDHPYSNPFVDKSTKEKVKNIGRCLVIGYDNDPYFVEMVKQQGVPVQARFNDSGFPGSAMRKATALLNFIKDFI